MTTSVQMLLDVAEQLSPIEQLELIQALSQSLQRHYQPSTAAPPVPDNAIPLDVPRAHPIKDLSELVADFWPSDETADDINLFVAQQRTSERTSDL